MSPELSLEPPGPLAQASPAKGTGGSGDENAPPLVSNLPVESSLEVGHTVVSSF